LHSAEQTHGAVIVGGKYVKEHSYILQSTVMVLSLLMADLVAEMLNIILYIL